MANIIKTYQYENLKEDDFYNKEITKIIETYESKKNKNQPVFVKTIENYREDVNKMEKHIKDFETGNIPLYTENISDASERLKGETYDEIGNISIISYLMALEKEMDRNHYKNEYFGAVGHEYFQYKVDDLLKLFYFKYKYDTNSQVYRESLLEKIYTSKDTDTYIKETDNEVEITYSNIVKDKIKERIKKFMDIYIYI